MFKIITLMLLAYAPLNATEHRSDIFTESYLLRTNYAAHVIQRNNNVIRDISIKLEIERPSLPSLFSGPNFNRFTILDNVSDKFLIPLGVCALPSFDEKVLLDVKMSSNDFVKQLQKLGRVEIAPLNMPVAVSLHFVLTHIVGVSL